MYNWRLKPIFDINEDNFLRISKTLRHATFPRFYSQDHTKEQILNHEAKAYDGMLLALAILNGIAKNNWVILACSFCGCKKLTEALPETENSIEYNGMPSFPKIMFIELRFACFLRPCMSSRAVAQYVALDIYEYIRKNFKLSEDGLAGLWGQILEQLDEGFERQKKQNHLKRTLH